MQRSFGVNNRRDTTIIQDEMRGQKKGNGHFGTMGFFLFNWDELQI